MESQKLSEVVKEFKDVLVSLKNKKPFCLQSIVSAINRFDFTLLKSPTAETRKLSLIYSTYLLHILITNPPPLNDSSQKVEVNAPFIIRGDFIHLTFDKEIPEDVEEKFKKMQKFKNEQLLMNYSIYSIKDDREPIIFGVPVDDVLKNIAWTRFLDCLPDPSTSKVFIFLQISSRYRTNFMKINHRGFKDFIENFPFKQDFDQSEESDFPRINKLLDFNAIDKIACRRLDYEKPVRTSINGFLGLKNINFNLDDEIDPRIERVGQCPKLNKIQIKNRSKSVLNESGKDIDHLEIHSGLPSSGKNNKASRLQSASRTKGSNIQIDSAENNQKLRISVARSNLKNISSLKKEKNGKLCSESPENIIRIRNNCHSPAKSDARNLSSSKCSPNNHLKSPQTDKRNSQGLLLRDNISVLSQMAGLSASPQSTKRRLTNLTGKSQNLNLMRTNPRKSVGNPSNELSQSPILSPGKTVRNSGFFILVKNRIAVQN